MTWGILKLLLGGWLKAAGRFIAANWRWLLPVVAALLLWWYIAHLQGQRDDAIKALAEYQQNVKAEAEKRKAENAAKEAAADNRIAGILAGHASEIDIIRRNYDVRTQTQQAAADRTVDLWRDRVRLEVARSATGLPEVPGAACEPAENGGDSHPAAARSAAETIASACAVTTADYNALWESWSAACAVHGCK